MPEENFDMPLTRFEEVQQFHEVFGHPVKDEPEVPGHQRLRLRLNLCLEETAEIVNAVAGDNHGVYTPMLDKVVQHLKKCQELVKMAEDYEFDHVDIVNLAKELADSTYVNNGFGLECGINLDDVGAEVHRSNMSKLDENGQPIYNEDGKVIKGPNYSPADVQGVLFPEPATDDAA